MYNGLINSKTWVRHLLMWHAGNFACFFCRLLPDCFQMTHRITFIKLSHKFEYGLCRITKWPPPASLHLWTLELFIGLQILETRNIFAYSDQLLYVNKTADNKADN